MKTLEKIIKFFERPKVNKEIFKNSYSYDNIYTAMRQAGIKKNLARHLSTEYYHKIYKPAINYMNKKWYEK